MKQRTCIGLALFIGLLLTGCVTSLRPLYTEKDLVYDQRIIGTWRPEGEKSDTWKFERYAEAKDKKNEGKFDFGSGVSDKAYHLTLTDDGKKGVFIAHLLKLENQYYLDFYPGPGNEINEVIEGNMVPVHTFAKVNFANNTFSIQFFNTDLVSEMLDKKAIRIKHESLEYQRVLTASTEELQQFIIKYNNYKDLFKEPVAMKKAA